MLHDIQETVREYSVLTCCISSAMGGWQWGGLAYYFCSFMVEVCVPQTHSLAVSVPDLCMYSPVFELHHGLLLTIHYNVLLQKICKWKKRKIKGYKLGHFSIGNVLKAECSCSDPGLSSSAGLSVTAVFSEAPCAQSWRMCSGTDKTRPNLEHWFETVI